MISNVKKYNEPQNCIKMSGNTAFVAGSGSGLQVINVSVLAAPHLRFNLAFPGDAEDVTLSGIIYAYVAAGVEGVPICNISDPDNPWIVSDVKGKDGTAANRVDYARGLVYATDQDVSVEGISTCVSSSTGVSAGTYFYRMTTEDATITRSMMLIK